MSILSNAPYYDRYDSSKQYTQLLAVPGRVAQARELTEIQSTMKDIIRSIGDSMMSDGNIIEGCQVIPDKANKKVTVTSGRVYFQGMVHNLAESTVDITATGDEIIGVKLKETIVTSSDDADLKDPALGYENYNQPGCDRLKSVLEVVSMPTSASSDSVALLATLIDGDLAVEQQAPNYNSLNETLARRTYDESGSYIVEGLEVRVENNPTDANTFNVVVESGKAYVHGYELTVPSARRIQMPRATTSVSVSARYNYATGSNYLLTTGPYAKDITKVTGTLESTESVTINNSQGAALRYNTAYNIIKVEKDGVEIPSSSYRIEQGPTSYIRWNATTYPGDNVLVTYYYTAEFTKGTDYELYLDSNNNHYLKWKDTSTVNPVVGESLIINYDKYLARKDTAYMDQYGNISVIQGTPADYGFEVAPDAPAYTLPLASIMSPPGGAITTDDDLKIDVNNVGLTRFTMSDIHKMLKRIRTIEYDQAVLSLNTEAKDYGTDDKRGIFTDPFIDLSKIDFSFNKSSTGSVVNPAIPSFDTTIDLEGNIVYLPLISKFADATYNPSTSNVSKNDRTVTLRKTGETPVLSQLKATKSYLVSPYLSYPQTPEVFVDPSLDTWYDDTIIDLPLSINTSKVISSSLRNTYTSSGSGSGVSYSTSTSVTNTSVGVTVDKIVSEDVIKEEAVTFIRPREVKVTGSNYPANLDNIACYFEGVKAALTPTGTTASGSATGTVKSDANGAFTATFTIPDNIRTGTRVVTLESPVKVDGYNSSAFTFYQAIGTARTIQRTLTTITTVLLERVTTVNTHASYYNPDPLAQTFILEDMTLLSGIDVYFESVPSGSVPVTCEIREVSNGNITSTIYGFKTLMSNNITVSTDGSVATRFKFNDPVLIESNKEYAFILKSPSQDFRVFVAEIGETDIQSGEIVVTNPYLVGVMMSSSNNSSWTTHQKTDIKFRLISDIYDTTSDIYFHNIHHTDGFCRICLAAESLVFEGTSIDWAYSLDNGTNYQSISPYNQTVIDQLGTDISLRARMTRNTNTSLSPVLALDSVTLSLACYDNTSDGYYVSNLITGLDEYDTIELILDTYEPSSTSITPYISPSANNASPYILKEIDEISSRELNYGWFERTYKVTLDDPATQCRLFVKLDSNSKFHTPIFRKLRAIMS